MQALRILLLIICAGCTYGCSSQEEVPEEVKIAFGQQYPSAVSIRWEMESDTEWEVEFKLQRQPLSATYLSDGSWEATEREIELEDAPEKISDALSGLFPDYELEEAEELETSQGTAYEFEIELDEEEFEVVLDGKGQLISKQKKD